MREASMHWSRRFYLFTVFIITFYPAGAQYLLKENFNHGIPSGWLLLDRDGLTPDSTQTDFVTDAWVPRDDPFNPGDTIVVSTSKYLPPGHADDWLITPPITLKGNSIMYWYALAFSSVADGYEVRISTSTPTDTAFLAHAPLFSLAAENTTWTRRSVDLSAYANRTVYLAFRNNSTDKFLLGIDDITVFDCSDIPADAGIIDTSTTVACSGFPDLNLGLSPSFLSGSPTTNISGNTNDIPNWNPLPGRPFEDDGSCCWGTSVNPPYQIIAFQVTATGAYNILQTQSGYDGVMYIYTDPLNLTVNPPVTFVAGNDDDDILGTGWSGIYNLTLNKNQNYYLISTGYSSTDLGNYSTDFTGPGNIVLSQVTTTDRPYDYHFVITNSSGMIVALGDNLSDASQFPGSATGDTFYVCGIAYTSASVNLTSFIGQPYSSLQTLAASSNCVALTSTCHTVVILSGGTVNTGPGDTVCAGTPVTLTASGGISYVWSTGDTGSVILVSAPYTTTYSVTATDGIGCTASAQVTVYIYSADGGKFNTTPTRACVGDSSLRLSLEPEFFFNFFPSASNRIIGNTARFFTWAPLPGRPFTDGTCCTGFNPIYDIKTFQVDQPGYYFISQTQINYDGVIYLYTDPFDLTANPPITFIAGNDDSSTVSNVSRIDSVFLEPTKVYYLISTGFDAGEYGDYITTITGAGNILLPGQPDTALYGYEFLAVNNAGIIIDFTEDLTDSSLFPGSPTGASYQVCAVSYLKDSVNISLYAGQPVASLHGISCLDLSDNCHQVTIFTPPVADAGTDISLCYNDTAFLAANAPVAGSGRWRIISGSGSFGNPFLPNTYVTGLAAGTNVLTWTLDNGGCSHTDTLRIFVELPVIDAGANDTICRGDTAMLMASGGIAYLWSTGDTTPSVTVAPAITTKYFVTVTAASGCSLKDSAIVKVNPLPSANLYDATICPGSCTILNAGNPGAGFIWSTGASTPAITVCTSGTFHVTVTDSNGCVNTDSAVVSIGSGLTVMLNDIAICEGDSVMLDAGNPGTSYLWSTGDTTQTIIVKDSGTYSVFVTDTNNCTGTDTAVISLLPLPVLSVSNDQTICAGDNIILTASGSGSFNWNTGDTTATVLVAPNSTTAYVVSLTGNNGCQSFDTVMINVIPNPLVDLGPDTAICQGDNITLFASGADTYLWNTGGTDSFITVSPATNTIYIVAATTAGLCTTTDSIAVTVKPAPVANAGSDKSICTGSSVSLTASGGGTYLWSNGNANSTITLSPSTSRYYAVTVTAPNGCTDTDSVFVEVHPLPEPGLPDSMLLCLGDLLTISAQGGGTYLWSTGATSEYIDVSPLNNQIYSVTVTSTAGCSATDMVAVIVRPSVTAQAGPNATICEGEQVILTASGGTAYQWSNGAGSASITVSPSSTRDYFVTVSNAFGCEDFATVTITVKDAPIIDAIFAPDTVCVSQSHLILGATPVGGIFTGAGISNDTLYPSLAGPGMHMIYYALTGPNGCTGTDSLAIYIDLCSGLSAIAGNAPAVTVYPNPFTGYFIIKMNNSESTDARLLLFDAAGKMLKEGSVKGNIQVVDMHPFASGAYMLKIISREGTIMKQIIKK
ncbi:MAG: hypothetical protein KatS3mg031_1043 [Chitinophagales bacterium]|nr:MAG: hypothetical protein KatS3mg031_1043 [Chitinophagales bacterium]